MEDWFFSSTIIKLNMSELYDNLAHEKLTMKSLVKFWQSVNGFLSTEVDENVITTDYYYDDDDQSFDHEKILMFLKKIWRWQNLIRKPGGSILFLVLENLLLTTGD